MPGWPRRADWGIHGTIAPASIYRFHRQGGIRFRRDNFTELFPRVIKGLAVKLLSSGTAGGALEKIRTVTKAPPSIEDGWHVCPGAPIRTAADRHRLHREIPWMHRRGRRPAGNEGASGMTNVYQQHDDDASLPTSVIIPAHGFVRPEPVDAAPGPDPIGLSDDAI